MIRSPQYKLKNRYRNVATALKGLCLLSNVMGMIKRIEIHFDEDPDAEPLILDFDFSITNTMYIDDVDELIFGLGAIKNP